MMKKIAVLFLGMLAAGFGAQAQVAITTSSLTYTQDFNTLDTNGSAQTNMPLGWSFYEWGGTSANTTYRAGTGSSNTGDTYSFGAAASAERALGSLCSGGVPKVNYGVAFANNTGQTISSFTVTFKEEQWRAGDTSSTNLDSVRFYYNTNATGVADSNFTNWIEVPALLMTSIQPAASSTSGNALNGNTVSAVKTATVTVNIPQGANFAFRWYDFNSIGSDDALSIDSLTASFVVSGPASLRPNITALSPANNATNVALTSNLVLVFNKAVTKGNSGSFYIKNETDQTTVTKAATSSDVSASGNTVIVSNLGLLSGKTYHVTFDSAAVDSAGYKSYGIYDTLAWRFTTVPPVITLTTLNQQFDSSCGNGNSLPAGWMQYSVTGAQTWHCSGASTAPNYYQTMNGGSGSPVTFNANEDWLITPKLNLSAMTTPKLVFRTRFRFAGDNMQVMVSNAYTGTGDPNAAAWTDLNMTYDVVADSNQWTTKTANLTPYKASPMYVAFRYSSTTASARQWDVDSVLTIDEPSGVRNISKANSLPVTVLGPAANGHVAIGFDLPKAATLQAAIYDMAGRIVYRGTIQGEKGANRVTLDPQTLQSGMYLIRLSTGDRQGIARTFIQ